MATKNNNEKPTQIIDVAKAEDTPAQATSRPVIVGHMNTMQKDPMVSVASRSGGDTLLSDAEKTIVSSKPEKTIAPPTVIEEPKDENVESGDVPADVAEEDQDQSAKSSETAIVDALVGDVNTKKERLEQDEKEKKQNDEIQQLVNSKQYFVKTRTPANKRNLRWFFVLIILVILAGIGWYFGMGPGKDMWAKTDTATAVSPASATPSAVPETPAPVVEEKAAFSNPALKVGFMYPKSWKVEITKDPEFQTIDVITLTSPVEQLKTATKGAPVVSAEVYLRTRIFIENTKNTKEYASDLLKLSVCSSEDIIVGTTNLKLLFLDTKNQAPNISQVSLSPENCFAAGSVLSGNDQLQLASKSNTYVVYSEYVMSEAYIKKNGATTKEAIDLAQESGIVATKADFKAGKAFMELTDLIKSFKES